MWRYDASPDVIHDITKILTKEQNNIKQKVSPEWKISFNTLRGELEHFLSLPIDKIQNYKFANQSPRDVIKTFEQFQEEWVEKSGERAVDIQEGDELIIKFGNDKGWWLLNRGACQQEGDAMGHCGNRPSVRSGDRILSFRIKNNQNQWTPYLTFILNGDKFLGEMKGRANEKPAAKYHPYIVELLKRTDIVKGIRGGGYAPENNFSLDDLDEKTRDMLADINPEYMTFFGKIKKFGDKNPIVIEAASKILHDYVDDKIKYNEENNYFIIREWKDADDLVTDYGNDTAKYINKIINGEDYLDIDYYDEDHNSIESFIDNIDRKEKKQGKNITIKQLIIEYLKSKYSEQFSEYDEDDYLSFINDEDIDEIKSAIASAMNSGRHAGIENEMYKAYKDAVLYYWNPDILRGDIVYSTDAAGDRDLYGPIRYVITPSQLNVLIYNDLNDDYDELQNALTDWEGERDSAVTVTEPNYGFDGFDIDSAIERLYDELPSEVTDMDYVKETVTVESITRLKKLAGL